VCGGHTCELAAGACSGRFQREIAAGDCDGRLRWEVAVGGCSGSLCSGLVQQALAFLCGRVGERLRVPSLRALSSPVPALSSPVPAPSSPVLNGVGCLQQNG